MSERIKAIQAAVEQSERCRATHVQSEPIVEKFAGEDVWGGVVEVFNLKGHPKATRAYAWRRKAQKPGEDAHYTVVLGLPPIKSARDAVKASIAALYKSIDTSI